MTKPHGMLDVTFSADSACDDCGHEKEDAKALALARNALAEMLREKVTSEAGRLRAIELLIATARQP